MFTINTELAISPQPVLYVRCARCVPHGVPDNTDRLEQLLWWFQPLTQG